jgi:hypothetical protein
MAEEGVEVEELLSIAAELPGFEARDSGSWVALRVDGKGFGYLSEDERRLLLKASRDEQAALATIDPETFAASFTAGQFGWIEIQLARVDRDELAELVTEAWRLTAPKRLTAALGP